MYTKYLCKISKLETSRIYIYNNAYKKSLVKNILGKI